VITWACGTTFFEIKSKASWARASDAPSSKGPHRVAAGRLEHRAPHDPRAEPDTSVATECDPCSLRAHPKRAMPNAPVSGKLAPCS
jgi:hypothetical protein